MNTFRHYKGVALIIVFVLILFVIGSFLPVKQNQQDPGIALIKPPFMEVVKASNSALDIVNEEAGISAYMKSSFSINLTSVRSTFTTIELETSDYILGSIDMPDYPGIYDPHIYVHTDGWILAYYHRPDPVSKIIDTKAWTIDSTLLFEAISIIASNSGVPVSDVFYYDFRYPNATHLMFIAENNTDGNNFTIQIPSTYGYYERSWATGNTSDPRIWFDGQDLSVSQYVYKDYNCAYGYISTGLFTTDYSHNVVAEYYGIIAIVYRVP